MKVLKKIILILTMILLFLVAVFCGAAYKLYSNVSYDFESGENLGVDLSDKNSNVGVRNIALFGVDTRDLNSTMNKGVRSDSIIILTIDSDRNKIKLSSVMRDTYVNIPGEKKDKINHAYAYGGPELAVKTLNTNFGLNIEDFVTVNFFGLANIIDALGGVDLDIKDSEIKEMNKYIAEVAKLEGKKADLIERAGVQTLSGMQAVSYSRIRKVGNGDYERTERQRRVLMAIIEKAEKMNSSNFTNVAMKCSKYIKTSLGMNEMLSIGKTLMKDRANLVVEDQRYPEVGEGKMIDGVWYMTTDLAKMRNSMRSYIYNDQK